MAGERRPAGARSGRAAGCGHRVPPGTEREGQPCGSSTSTATCTSRSTGSSAPIPELAEALGPPARFMDIAGSVFGFSDPSFASLPEAQQPTNRFDLVPPGFVTHLELTDTLQPDRHEAAERRPVLRTGGPPGVLRRPRHRRPVPQPDVPRRRVRAGGPGRAPRPAAAHPPVLEPVGGRHRRRPHRPADPGHADRSRRRRVVDRRDDPQARRGQPCVRASPRRPSAAAGAASRASGRWPARSPIPTSSRSGTPPRTSAWPRSPTSASPASGSTPAGPTTAPTT